MSTTTSMSTPTQQKAIRLTKKAFLAGLPFAPQKYKTVHLEDVYIYVHEPKARPLYTGVINSKTRSSDRFLLYVNSIDTVSFDCFCSILGKSINSKNYFADYRIVSEEELQNIV
jgi:hypothetical protein